jgi:hypothetical protein
MAERAKEEEQEGLLGMCSTVWKTERRGSCCASMVGLKRETRQTLIVLCVFCDYPAMFG